MLDDHTRKKLPAEVQKLLAIYESEVEWPSWTCGECGCEYPRDIVTACLSCSPAAKAILEKPTA